MFLYLAEEGITDQTVREHLQKIEQATQLIQKQIWFTDEYDIIGITVLLWRDPRTLVDIVIKQVLPGQARVKNTLPAGIELFADPLIVMVFINMMDNAVRYGRKITSIRFFIIENGDDHIVVCEDDGVGVPAEEKEKIFERGFGQDNGLGLALAREILDITGITLKEAGELGNGARFEITVPKGLYRFTVIK